AEPLVSIETVSNRKSCTRNAGLVSVEPETSVPLIRMLPPYARSESDDVLYTVALFWMNTTSTRESALLRGPSHAISTTRDHTLVASFEKVDVRPAALTIEPASPHDKFEATSPASVSTNAVHPGAGIAIVTLPGGNEFKLSCRATPK